MPSSLKGLTSLPEGVYSSTSPSPATFSSGRVGTYYAAYFLLSKPRATKLRTCFDLCTHSMYIVGEMTLHLASIYITFTTFLLFFFFFLF